MKNKRLILVISHRRSGTHWVIDSLRNNLPAVSYQFYNLDQIYRCHKKHIPVKDLVLKISKSPDRYVILKTHMTSYLTPFSQEEREFVENLVENSKMIYVYRDGRDVLVSLYHYMREFREDLPEFSDFIRMSNDFDPYYCSVNRVEYWKEHVEGWLGRSNLDIATVSYEQLHTDYVSTIRKLSEFLGLTIKPSGVDRIKFTKYRLFRRLLRRVVPLAAKSSAIAPRKGVIGDWKNYFSQSDLDLFNKIAGTTMAKLGYYR